MRLAAAAGVHGVYIQNVLTDRAADRVSGEFLAFHGADALLGVAYFGPRGNLLVILGAALDPEAVAREILTSLWAWRIVLAPAAVVHALVARGRMRPLVNRQQVYYAVTAETLAREEVSGEVRLAEKRDLKALMEASLHLNETDLHVDRWRVDRDWLRRNTRERIRRGWTYVLGAVGEPVAKLDFGSAGPAGVVIEGVYTWPRVRSKGHASGLIAAVCCSVFDSHPLVCLHVSADNDPARRAYEKCGMTEAGVCQLMLRD